MQLKETTVNRRDAMDTARQSRNRTCWCALVWGA